MKKNRLSIVVSLCLSISSFASLKAQDGNEGILSGQEEFQNCAYLTIDDYKNNIRSYTNKFVVSDHRNTEMAKEWCKVDVIGDTLLLDPKRDIWAIQRGEELYVNMFPRTKVPLFIKVNGDGRYALLIMVMPDRKPVLKEMKASPEMIQEMQSKKDATVVSAVMLGLVGAVIVGAVQSENDPFYVIMDKEDGSFLAFSQEVVNDYVQRYPALSGEYQYLMANLMQDEDYRIFVRDLNLASEGKPVPARYSTEPQTPTEE